MQDRQEDKTQDKKEGIQELQETTREEAGMKLKEETETEIEISRGMINEAAAEEDLKVEEETKVEEDLRDQIEETEIDLRDLREITAEIEEEIEDLLGMMTDEEEIENHTSPEHLCK